jgi:hypothetical protein
MVFMCSVLHAISTLHVYILDTCMVCVFIQLLHVYVTVKKNFSDIIAVENILALSLCCDLMMAWTLGRNV